MSTHVAGNSMESDTICVLTIAGLDPSGGAGLTADARAQSAFGAHCCPIATAVIAQNTRGVSKIEAVSPSILAAQIDCLLEDIAPRAVKIGMVPGLAHAQIIAARLKTLRHLPIVVDTVFAPSRGPQFADEATVRCIAEQWLPLCDIVTPNTLEAARLCDAPVDDLESMKRAAVIIHERFGARHVLVKGGHRMAKNDDASNEAVDIFFDGKRLVELRAPRIGGYEVRGTGCLLASALAAQRARDAPAEEAARRAKIWLTQQIQDARVIGGGARVALNEG